MPGSFNGFGTTFYGEREYRPDGSFVTTEWVIAAMVPIFPLRSFRLIPTKDNAYMVIYSSQKYLVLEKTACHRQQVTCTYAFVAASLGWFFFVGSCVERFEPTLKALIPDGDLLFALATVVIAFLPIVILYFFRRRMRRSAVFSNEALAETMRHFSGAQQRTASTPPPIPMAPPPIPQSAKETDEIDQSVREL